MIILIVIFILRFLVWIHKTGEAKESEPSPRNTIYNSVKIATKSDNSNERPNTAEGVTQPRSQSSTRPGTARTRVQSDDDVQRTKRFRSRTRACKRDLRAKPRQPSKSTTRACERKGAVRGRGRGCRLSETERVSGSFPAVAAHRSCRFDRSPSRRRVRLFSGPFHRRPKNAMSTRYTRRPNSADAAIEAAFSPSALGIAAAAAAVDMCVRPLLRLLAV